MAEKRKKLPIGIDRFEKLRKTGCYYVDKTGIIKELLDEACEVSLFTRPRRFGKSLNIDMMKNFFEIGADPLLFEGLEIFRFQDLCAEHFGKYPVISLSLKDVWGNDYESAEKAFESMTGMEVRRICVKYALLESSILLESDKVYLKNVLAGKQEQGMAACLKRVFQYLSEVCGKKVILFMDEYDVPLDYAYQKGYYEQMLGVFRNLLSSILKSNDNLQFAVLTGCLRIAKESIFTGLNNFVVNSVLDEEYSEYFGFTQAEVSHMLQYYGMEEHQDAIQEWYDGYRFGGTAMYCPWDVLNYLRKYTVQQN